MEDKKYQEYAKLKAKIKELTGKAKQLEIDLINELDGVEGNKLMTNYATFSLVGRKKYKYTDALVAKEKLVKDQIKLMKKKEEVGGTAELLTDGWMLRCQLSKGDK